MMWGVVVALLAVLLGALWWLVKPGPCSIPTGEGEQVKLLLDLLVESRWHGLVYKLLYRCRHCRARMSSAGPSAAGRPARAGIEDPLAAAWSLTHQPLPSNVLETLGQPIEQPEIPLAAVIPLCPECERPMIRRGCRSDQGLFWGCVAYLACRGIRRPGGTGGGQPRA